MKESLDILGKLLGGVARVKVMRLFLLNPTQGFEATDVALRSRVGSGVARRVVLQLASVGLIHKHSFIKEIENKRTGKTKKKRTSGWFLNGDFPYISELRQLLVEGDFFKHADLVKRFRSAGRIHLFVVSGIFIGHSGNRLDMLIVGDHLRRSVIQKAVSILESELGRELAYAVFDTNDFKYRVSMYDKLIRDVFDYPHERLIASKDFSSFVLPNTV
ncbi:MAG TPA: hypothetical protein VG982_02955 [Candidatus Paceibacterota bacterium]|jgi:hypothetical protein|nr:hypothetical protein [Candidatus Paceibacterota bacterium]